MGKTLAAIAIVGFLMSAAFFAGAAFSGGDVLGALPGWAAFDRLRAHNYVDSGGPFLPGDSQWNVAGKRITIDVPADIRVNADPNAKETRIAVHGPKDWVARLRFDGSHLTDTTREHTIHTHGTLHIDITGAPLDDYDIAIGQMDLGHVDQDMLRIHLEGAGEVRAEGKVSSLELHMEGAGDAKLGRLTTGSATVHIEGAGHAVIAPTDSADIHIEGVGEVHLNTKPKHLMTHLEPAFLAHVEGPDGGDDNDGDDK